MKKILSFVRATNPKLMFFLLIFFPAFLSALFSFLSLFSFRNLYKESLKSSYSSMLQVFSENEENTISGISNSIKVLSEDTLFFNTVSGQDNSANGISHLQSIIKKIALNYNSIDSICIADRSNHIVYTATRSYDFDEYFTDTYCYENYDATYWNDYSAPISEKFVLSPTLARTAHDEKVIVPLVFTKIGNRYTPNIIIVNLDLSIILSDLNSYGIFTQSVPSMFNKKTCQNFSVDSTSILEDDTFLYNLTADKFNCFDWDLYGKKCFIVSYAPSYSVWGYVYLVATPYSVLTSMMPAVLNLLFVINSLFLVLILFLSFRESEVAYLPFKRIADLFPNRKDVSFDELHHTISDVLGSNQVMQQQLEHSLPLLEEQRLIRFLNSTEHYGTISYSNSEDLSCFGNKYFCSIILRLVPTESFYKKYDNITEKAIELGIYNLAKSEFSQNFKHMYIIPSNEHTLYILLNPETQDVDPAISDTIQRLEHAFSYDTEDLNITIFSGSVQLGLSGLRQSHKEAMSRISNSNLFQHVHLQIDDTCETLCVFSFADETVLYNHLIASNTDKAMQLMRDKYSNYFSQGASEDEITQLLTHFFNLIFRVFRIKKIDYDSEKIGDAALIERCLKSEDSVWENITALLDILKKQNDSKRINVNSILQYIQENYTEDIYQDQLAEKFNTSASYLSRLIKKETSVTFSEYINLLRINKAKDLLMSTNKTVKEVYEAVGYNNRNTFIRTFKSIVGVTPSEFKKSVESSSI